MCTSTHPVRHDVVRGWAIVTPPLPRQSSVGTTSLGPIDGQFAGSALGFALMSWDDDDWVGEPPEGRYTRDRAKPEFWRQPWPWAGAGTALLLLIVVVVLAVR
jgi:hypothetical protein